MFGLFALWLMISSIHLEIYNNPPICTGGFYKCLFLFPG